VRLLIDLQPMQGPSAERGIGYYALSLTQALAATRGEHELVVLLDAQRSPQNVLKLRHRLAPHLERGDIRLFESPPLEQRVPGRRDAGLAREAAIAAVDPDVVLLTSVFELAPLAPMSVNEWCTDVPTAAVLYDLIPLADLDLYKPDRVLRSEYLTGIDRLVHADLLLAISDHTAAEARRLIADCPAVTTVHGAAPPPLTARTPRRPPPSGFALAVGRDEPRKDIATAVLAWAGLPPSVRRGRPFVVVGEWPQENQLRLIERARAAGLPSEDLVFAGQVDDHEMAWFYEQADVFLFPSLLEGLGLPPLEAMHVGTPALLARASSLIELVDDDRAYFEPGDVDDLRRRLVDLLTDGHLRDELVAAGRRVVDHFTWTRTAEITWKAIGELAPRSRGVQARRLAWVAGAGETSAVTAELGRTHQLTLSRLPELDDWGSTWRGQDRTVYELGSADAWAAAHELLADAPGVVVLGGSDPLPDDVATALAPVIGVLVGAAAQRTALLRAGVVEVPVLVTDLNDADAVAASLEALYAGDVGGHWARGAALLAEPLDGSAVERRPRWAARAPKLSLLASDVTVYRSTPFMSGIQRTAARLHHALGHILQEHGGALVPFQVGVTPEGVPHPDIRADPVLAAAEVRPTAPDWLLCIDLDSQLAAGAARLQEARARGVGLAVNIFDLIPHTHPHWFPPGAAATSFTPWLRATVEVADVLLVNSRATAEDLETYVRQAPPRRQDGFTVSWLPLGCDFEELGEVGTCEREAAHFLMVGTVEPRKGHRTVLDAFERLWDQGAEVELTVLGRSGWMVEEVTRRMELLSATQPRFTWLQNASDSELDRRYRTCAAAIVASEGEGFGLPVVEATMRGCPVIVNDIPVLREVAGEGATFFSPQRPLADVLTGVLAGAGVAQASQASLRTWRDVGMRLLRILDGQEPPLAQWTPEDGWSWA
jgi:glycosyltransferase involved in cell wall biosynthesis